VIIANQCRQAAINFRPSWKGNSVGQDNTLHCMLPARNLLNTVVTRSKKLLVVIGQMKALAMTLKPAGYEKMVFVIDLHTTSDRHWL
jgi:hypothetical protein